MNFYKSIPFSLLGGVLIGISWPPFSIVPIIFFAFVPLFYLLESGKRYKTNHLFNIAIFFMVWVLISLFWLFKAASSIGIVATIVYLIPLLLILSPFTIIQRKLGTNIAYVYFMLAWLSFEYLSARWDLGSPFLSLGYSLAPIPQLYQWYEYTGVIGGTLWILTCNFIIYRLISSIAEKKKIKNWIVATVSILCVPSIISLVIFNTTNIEGKQREVVVIHPNTDNFNEKYAANLYDLIKQYTDLTNEKVNGETKLVVWPETAITNGGWISKLNEFPVYDSINLYLENASDDMELLSGAICFEFVEKHSREAIRNDAPNNASFKYSDYFKGYFKTFNAAISLNWTNDNRIHLGAKQKLVPFQERTPYPQFLRFTHKLAKPLGKDFQFSVLPDKHLRNNKWETAPLICYESAFGRYTSKYVLNGAKLIAVLLNEGWYKSMQASKQFLFISCVRAVENRRYVVRSSNGGISGFIDFKGKPFQSFSKNEATALRSKVTLSDKTTFYAKHGDFIGLFAFILSGCILLLLIFNNKINKLLKSNLL